jgi:hypothetical protein
MYSKYKPDPVHPDDKEIFDQIKKDGFIVIPDYFNSDDCDKLLEEVETTYQKVKTGDHPDYFKHERGHERIGKINTHSGLAEKLFYNDEQIWRIAKAYVSKNVLAYRKEADLKLEAGTNYQANIAHFDDWRQRFKAFLFLHDVNEENAPMIYYRRSHRREPWKKKYEKEFEIDGVNGRYGHFFPQEMDQLCRSEGLEPVVLTAKKGSLFLGDFRGIHQGTILKSGRRILLNCTFGL